MAIHQPQDQPLADVRVARCGVEAFNAGLEIVSSPAALWLRLSVAVILGSVLASLGLIVSFRIIEAARGGTLNDFGGTLGPLVGAAACIVLSAIGFTAGWKTFKAYRRRGLI